MTARVRLVEPQPAEQKRIAKPRLRRMTLADSERAHPNNPEHARRWLRAIVYLRTRAKCGWLMDRPTPRQEQR